jgi:hypothetical protein
LFSRFEDKQNPPTARESREILQKDSTRSAYSGSAMKPAHWEFLRASKDNVGVDLERGHCFVLIGAGTPPFPIAFLRMITATSVVLVRLF